MSAAIAARAFKMIGKTPKIEFVQYGTKKHTELTPDYNQMFIDITPPISRADEWKKFSPVILDHHITAKHVTESCNGVYGDMNESGATLAYKYVMQPICDYHGVQPAYAYKELADLVMIRDTWKRYHRDWIMAIGLAEILTDRDPFSFIEEMSVSGGVSDSWFSSIIADSKRAGEKIAYRASTLARKAFITEFCLNNKNYTIGLFNCTDRMTSDTANTLLECGCDIAAGFSITCEDEKINVVVSIRTDGTFSARKIAEYYGGGGHERSAGFSIKGESAINATVNSIINDIVNGVYHYTAKMSIIIDKNVQTKQETLQNLKNLRNH
jgi:hypothetical protein